MQYTIDGYSQLEAFNLSASITENGREKTLYVDIIDLAILRWFDNFYSDMQKTVIDGEEYAWVNYAGLLGDIPLLRVSKRRLAVRFMKLVRLGVLSHATVRDAGTFSYYGFGPEYGRLLVKSAGASRAYGHPVPKTTHPIPKTYHPIPKTDHPYTENGTGGVPKTYHQINPSTKYNPSTKSRYPSNPPTGGTAAGSPNHPVPAEPSDRPILQTTGSGNESDSTKPKASSSMPPSNPSPSESDSTKPLRHQTTTWSPNQTDGTKPLGRQASNPPVPADPPSPIPDVHAAVTEAVARVKRVWEPNRFDGLTVTSRFMLEAAWPRITAAADGMDPVAWFEARCRAYCEATPPQYVKRFSRWVGGEQYLTEWHPDPAGAAGGADSGMSKSQRNAEYNKRFILEQLRKEQEQEQGGISC